MLVDRGYSKSVLRLDVFVDMSWGILGVVYSFVCSWHIDMVF